LQPVSARAQQSTKVYRIAMLHPSHPATEMTETSSLPYFRAFFEEFRRLGYVEGKNVLIECFSGEGNVEKYAPIVDKVINRNFDVVFAHTAWMIAPLKKATSTIPIVAVSSDPIHDGLVTSLAHPGGNLTGVSVDPGLELRTQEASLFSVFETGAGGAGVGRGAFLVGPLAANGKSVCFSPLTLRAGVSRDAARCSWSWCVCSAPSACGAVP